MDSIHWFRLGPKAKFTNTAAKVQFYASRDFLDELFKEDPTQWCRLGIRIDDSVTLN
jgi:hypothetical protein